VAALASLTPKEDLAKFLEDPRITNSGVWNWYARSAEALYHMGFDRSPAFTPENVQNILAQPEFQNELARFGLTPADVQERLSNISKLEVISNFIGAT